MNDLAVLFAARAAERLKRWLFIGSVLLLSLLLCWLCW